MVFFRPKESFHPVCQRQTVGSVAAVNLLEVSNFKRTLSFIATVSLPFQIKVTEKRAYVDTAGKNTKRMEEYIRHQLDEDKVGEQLTMENF